MDVVIRTMKDLYDARERQIALSKVLSTHYQELNNIRQILRVVQQEKVLQVQDMVEDLEQLRLHGISLNTFLQELGKERGQIKQYANQFFNGKRSLEDLADMMASMGRAKANLSIKIQVVHVGLTRSVGDVVVVNCEMVEELDRKLQKLFGQGQGLRLAELLQHKKRHSKYSSSFTRPLPSLWMGFYPIQWPSHGWHWTCADLYLNRRWHDTPEGLRHCLSQRHRELVHHRRRRSSKKHVSHGRPK